MKRMYLAIVLAFLNAAAFAQNGGGSDVSVDVTKTTSESSIPWTWIVGGVIVLIVILALLLGRGGSDRIVEKKTIVKE